MPRDLVYWRADLNRGEIVSIYAGLNRNQSYDPETVRSGVTVALQRQGWSIPTKLLHGTQWYHVYRIHHINLRRDNIDGCRPNHSACGRLTAISQCRSHPIHQVTIGHRRVRQRYMPPIYLQFAAGRLSKRVNKSSLTITRKYATLVYLFVATYLRLTVRHA